MSYSDKAFAYSEAKCGCEGCLYENKETCPGEDNQGKLIKTELRTCFDIENNKELIIKEV